VARARPQRLEEEGVWVIPDDDRHHPPRSADELEDPWPPCAEMLLARRVARDVVADRVAVVLAAGPEHGAVVRGSDPVLVVLGDMAETVGQGPAHDVLATGRPSAVEDLHAGAWRWPLLVGTFAVPEQLRSLLLLPLRGQGGRDDGHDVFGVLVLARDRPLLFTPAQVTTALRGSALLSAMVMARTLASGDGAAAGEDLDSLLDPRTDLVPQAVGVLAQRHGLTGDDAHRQLQATAFAAGRTTQHCAQLLLEQMR